MKKIYIDLETTGLDPVKNGVTQIGGVIEIDGIQKERFNFFSRPMENDLIEDGALAVTKKTREEIAAYPSARLTYGLFITMLQRYVDQFRRYDKFLFIGYNARFDMDFLREYFTKNGDKYFGSYFFFPPPGYYESRYLSFAGKAAYDERF